MSYRISIEGSELGFDCDDGQTVLEAAEDAGLLLPYSCRKGACATCEGVLAAGSVALGHGESAPRRDGPAEGVKFCLARPCSDLRIVPTRVEHSAPPQRRTLVAKVHRIERPAADVVMLRLRFPAGERMSFRAGQYLQLAFGDGERRDFSMANPPHESDGVQLHIRVVPGGRFSQGVLGRVDKGDEFQVDLPYGDFFVRDGDGPMLLLATGTGFAPIKSMMEDLIRAGNERQVHLYWGARTAEDLYLSQLPRKWAARHPWFHFVPVLSEASAAALEGAREGLLHEHVALDHPDLGGFQVYACGNPAMTAAARERLVQRCGLPPEHFYSDAFVASGDEQG